jgi:hypothetical protein
LCVVSRADDDSDDGCGQICRLTKYGMERRTTQNYSGFKMRPRYIKIVAYENSESEYVATCGSRISVATVKDLRSQRGYYFHELREIASVMQCHPVELAVTIVCVFVRVVCVEFGVPQVHILRG